jgi:hypothetical protein
MNVRKYCLKKYGDPLHRVFGVAVRDEAHTAAGLGSKSYSAVLNVPAEYSLSFTATPKIQHLRYRNHVCSEVEEELAKDDKKTFLHLHNKILHPSVPSSQQLVGTEDPEQRVGMEADLASLECPLLRDTSMVWHPFDFLSENLLFVETDDPLAETDDSLAGSSSPKFDWEYFKKLAEEEEKAVIVFFVKLLPESSTPKYDVVYNYYTKEFEYFGPLFPSTSSESGLKLTSGAWCFGVTNDFKTLCKPDCQKARDLVVHDMSHIGKGNYIGPIIHTLSFQKCIASKGLCGPRAVLLMPSELTKSKYDTLISKRNLEILLGMDKKLTPDKIKWRLTIKGPNIDAKPRVVEATAHQFRAMQQLMGCFKLDGDHKPVRRALVFCTDGRIADTCMKIFRALLQREGNALKIYVNRIFSSDAHTQSEMTYGEQQEILREFSSAELGVIFNVRLIGIGVDMPGIDAVQIMAPTTSVSRIVQAFGRAMRLDRKFEEKQATFIIPAISPFQNDWSKHEPQSQKEIPVLRSPSDAAPAPPDAAPPKNTIESMEPVLAHQDSVAAPVVTTFESQYHLHLRLAISMIDKDVEQMAELFKGTHITNDKKVATTEGVKKSEYEGETADQLLKVRFLKPID